MSYFLYTEVFSPDSKTSYFNRAVDRIKKDPRCLSVLGESKKITAYGEETWNKWRRARPISWVVLHPDKLREAWTDNLDSSKSVTDAGGNEHLIMRFHVGTTEPVVASLRMLTMASGCWSAEQGRRQHTVDEARWPIRIPVQVLLSGRPWSSEDISGECRCYQANSSEEGV